MQKITDMEQRITAALERIARAVAKEPRRVQDHDAPVRGEAALDGEANPFFAELQEERMANAQLQERLRSLRERELSSSAGHEAAIAALKAVHVEQSRDLAALVDRMTKEMNALRAERRAEAEEIKDIVAALNPLIEEARHA